MASISSVGIGSGVLTSDLIDKLAAAEREPAELRLNLKEEEVTTQLSDMGLIKSALSDLRISSRVLENPDALQARTTSSSDSAITVTAEDGAPLGTHELGVTNLAEAHVQSSAFTFTDANLTAVGTGTLTISDGTTTVDLAISSANNTLNGIAKAINGVSGLNVTATVLNTSGSNYKLMLSSDSTGLDNAMTVSVSGDGDSNDTDNSGLSRLINVNMTQSNAALDANFTLNGIALSRSSNTVTDVLENVTFAFTDATTSAATVSISQDSTAISDRVQDFVDKYNEFKEIVNEVTEYDPDTQEGGSLLGNASLALVDRQIKNIFGSVVTGLDSASVRSLTELGVSTDKDTGLMSFNSSTFKTVLANAEENVAALLGESGSTTDSQVTYINATDETVAGTYAVTVTRLATQGQYIGNVDLSGGLTIDADNDTFVLNVDGVTSGTITLTQQAYGSGSALVTELQTQLDADSTLSSNGVSVTVGLDANNFLSFTSGSYGSNSSVTFSSLDTDSAADFGLKGAYVGNVDVSGGLTIDADNNTFTLEVDGVVSNTITLTQASYSSAALATELQTQINADTLLTAAGKSVTVSIDANNFIKITSDSSGTASSVNIETVDTDSETDMGLLDRDGVNGVDVAGTINGAAATGSAQRLKALVGDNSEGISIDIIGGSTGSRGTVTYVKGVANKMVELINSFLKSDGTISGSIDGYNDTLAEIDEDRLDLAERIESLTSRLARQFTAMDIIISQLKTTENFVKNQLAMLNGTASQDG